jgi:hypothetical protein
MDWDQEERILKALATIADALEAQNQVLEAILARLPQPASYHPVSAAGSSITVRS